LNNEDYINSLSIFEIYRVAWANKLFIIFLTSLFSISSIIYSLSLPNLYTSTALVTFPKDSSSISSQLGGLASLGTVAGISLPEDDSFKNFKEAMMIMNSKSFIYNFLDRKGHIPLIMATKDWKPNENIFIYNDKIYDLSKQEWTRKVVYPRTKKPTSTEIAKEFHKNILSSDFSLKDETLSISLTFFSPFLAQEMLIDLIEEVNIITRAESIKEIDNKIEYINEKIRTEENNSLKMFFSKELESELTARIIAVNKLHFVFKVIDEPSLALKKSRPSRSIIVIFSSFIGGIFSLLFLILLNVYKGYSCTFNYRNFKFEKI